MYVLYVQDKQVQSRAQLKLNFLGKCYSEARRLVFTVLVQQHHDAVSMGVAIEMSRDDMTVLPEDGNQFLVVTLSYSSDASGKGQEAHRHVGYDEHL